MKHFACNSMENARFQVDVVADERALHEVYLPHFKQVASEGVAAVMSAYNSLNGHWCGDSYPLLTEILRHDWGWDGLVITDPAQFETLAAGFGDGGAVAGSSKGGDRASLRLHPADEQLIAAAAEVCDRVVVAVMAGSAVVMPWLDTVDAALMVWYPGSEGGHALADVLFGYAEPGGRLPFAVPREESDLVDFDRDATTAHYGLLHGQWHLDANGTSAHLPYGHGLGYTSFELGEAETAGDEVVVAIANTGDRAGSTVVQVYASVLGSTYERPPKRLVGFVKVRLAAGESTELRIPVDRSQLDLRIDGSWLREDSPLEYSVGFDAATARRI